MDRVPLDHLAPHEGHPAHAVAPVALGQYQMGGLCRAMGQEQGRLLSVQ